MERFVNLVNENNKKNKDEEKLKNSISVAEYLEKLNSSTLKEIITTGYVLYMCMEVLPSITHAKITRSDIYEEFIKGFIKREVAKLSF